MKPYLNINILLPSIESSRLFSIASTLNIIFTKSHVRLSIRFLSNKDVSMVWRKLSSICFTISNIKWNSSKFKKSSDLSIAHLSFIKRKQCLCSQIRSVSRMLLNQLFFSLFPWCGRILHLYLFTRFLTRLIRSWSLPLYRTEKRKKSRKEAVTISLVINTT